jgi:hypothetical protein
MGNTWPICTIKKVTLVQLCTRSTSYRKLGMYCSMYSLEILNSKILRKKVQMIINDEMNV